MEKLGQTRPTTVTKETKNHPAAKDQDGMKLGDDKLVWITPTGKMNQKVRKNVTA